MLARSTRWPDSRWSMNHAAIGFQRHGAAPSCHSTAVAR